MSMVSFQIAECFTRIGSEHQPADSDGTKHIFPPLHAATCATQVSFSRFPYTAGMQQEA